MTSGPLAPDGRLSDGGGLTRTWHWGSPPRPLATAARPPQPGLYLTQQPRHPYDQGRAGTRASRGDAAPPCHKNGGYGACCVGG